MFKQLSLVLLLLVSSFGFSFSKDTLTIAYYIEPPFVVKSQEAQLSGPSVWLWENIAQENNLAFKYVELPLEKALQALKDNKADACLSPLTITSQRYRVINFSSPYHTEHASLLENHKSSFQVFWQFISSFFSINFWRALGALAFIIGKFH